MTYTPDDRTIHCVRYDRLPLAIRGRAGNVGWGSGQNTAKMNRNWDNLPLAREWGSNGIKDVITDAGAGRYGRRDVGHGKAGRERA